MANLPRTELQRASAHVPGEIKHPRPVQACTQCRNRKLKCVMEMSDGSCGPPCKRCRRESKQCTLPPTKRRRYVLEDMSSMPASRTHRPETTSSSHPRQSPNESTISVEKVYPSIEERAEPAAKRKALSQDQPHSRPSKAQKDENTDDAYVMSTAAPWILDFLPVTFCATIADLGQAFDYHSPAAMSESTSPPSTVNGDEGNQKAGSYWSPEPESNSSSHNLSPANLQNPLAYGHGQDASNTVSSYSNDLGLDDIFNYIRFG
jgi:hypothetical protein